MDILEGCKSLNDVCRRLYGKANYTNREKVKRLLGENGIDWQQWLDSIKNDVPKVFCKQCGKEIPNGYKKRKLFCNSSCAASYNNKGRVMSIETREKIAKSISKDEKHIMKPLESGYCLNCGKVISKRRKYCSLKCQQEYQSRNIIKKWKSGEYDGISGEYSLSRSIRAYLLEKHDYKCEISVRNTS